MALTGAGAALKDVQTAEIAAAKAANRRLDPVKFVTDIPVSTIDDMLEDETFTDQDYVTPGGKTISAVYVNLRNHVNRSGQGLGSITLAMIIGISS